MLHEFAPLCSFQRGGRVCSRRSGAVEEVHAGIRHVDPVRAAVQRPAVMAGVLTRGKVHHHGGQRHVG